MDFPRAAWVFLTLFGATSCFEAVSLQECRTSTECSDNYPLCVDGRCFHHSLQAPVPWCPALSGGVREECCNLLAQGALEQGGCVRRVERPGSVVAGPVWRPFPNRFVALERGLSPAALTLVSFRSDGTPDESMQVPLPCEEGRVPELLAGPSAVWVSCGGQNWLQAGEITQVWQWEEGESKAPLSLCGEQWALRTLATGLQIHQRSTDQTYSLPLWVQELPPELGTVCDGTTGFAYVPVNAGEGLAVVDLAQGTVQGELGAQELGGPIAGLALGSAGQLWVLLVDGTVSKWEPAGPGEIPARSWVGSAWGKPRPLPGTFGVSDDTAWYLGEGHLLVKAACDDTVTVADVQEPDLTAYLPLRGKDAIHLAVSPSGLRLTVEFAAWDPVWPGAQGISTLQREVKCMDSAWAQPTGDGVFAYRCDGQIVLLATPSPGRDGVWLGKNGPGATRCGHHGP